MREWVLDKFEVYGRSVLVATVLVGPLAFNLASKDTFNLTKLTVLWVLGITSLWIWSTLCLTRGKWLPKFRLGYAALAFLGAYALAAVFSHAPKVSILGVYGRYGGVVPFVLYAAIMLVIVGLHWERPEGLRRIVRALTAGSILTSVYVLIQASGTDWLPWASKGAKPIGTMGNSNFSGGYLGICVPLVLYMALTTKQVLLRRFLQVAFVANLAAVWFAQARGGIVAATLGLATMAFAYRDRLPKWLKISAVTGALLVALLLALALWHPGSDKPPGFVAKAQVFDSKTLRDRTWYWAAAWNIFVDHPIVGAGPDTYYREYTKYRLPADGAELGLTITDKPHNIYFEYAASSGIIGLSAYLGLVGLAVFYGHRRSRHAEEPERLLLVAFLGSLVAYLSQGFFSIDVPPVAVMGWIALGGVAVLADPLLLKSRKSLQSAKQPKWIAKRTKNRPRVQTSSARAVADGESSPMWLYAAAGVASAALLLTGLRPMIADVYAKSAEAKLRRGRTQAATTDASRATTLNPLEGNYLTLAADFAQQAERSSQKLGDKKRQLLRAIDGYERALQVKPGDPLASVAAASTHTELSKLDKGHFAVADAVWRRVVAMDPTDWAVHNQYARFLDLWAESTGEPSHRAKAVEQLIFVTRMRPKDIGHWMNLGQNYLSLGRIEKAKVAVRHALKIDPTSQPARDLLADLEQKPGAT
ncbi:MAG: O-antigen ligase family protein [Actinomycetota bacterium]